MRLSGESGFTLVEVIIVASVGVVISLGLAQVLSQLVEARSISRLELEVEDMVADVRRALIRGKSCNETLMSSGQPLLTLTAPPTFPMALQRIVDENSIPLIERGGDFGGGRLRVAEISAVPSPGSPPWGPSQLVGLTISIVYVKSAGLLGVQSGTRQVTVTVETGANQEMVVCNAVDRLERVEMERRICLSMGGIMAGAVCDLKRSRSIIEAACQSVGMQADPGSEHCR